MKLLIVILVAVATASCVSAWPQEVVIVNGQSNSERAAEADASGSQEEEAFIVVAATVNDDDPNEAFIPTKNNGGGDEIRPTFNLLSQKDLEREDLGEVIEAADGNEGSSSFIPTNDNGPAQPGFKLLSREDLAREESNDDAVVIVASEDDDEEPRLLDIPRDTSGSDEPFFKLPLPDEEEEDEYDDVVVIGVGGDEEGRTLEDIPRDESGPNNAGFKLPLPAEPDDVEVIEVGGDDEEEGRSLGEDIPHDDSEDDEAGPRLPKRLDDDVAIIEVGDEDEVDCFAEREPGTCLNSHEAWFYDPTHNKCHFFIYSGCGGNSNRFFTEEACLSQCKDAKKSNKKVGCTDPAPDCNRGCSLAKDEETGCLICNCQGGNDVSLQQRCLAPPKTGLCKALLKYWYYNADRQACEEFTYGGCEAGSSPNKFRTKALCETTCAGISNDQGQ